MPLAGGFSYRPTSKRYHKRYHQPSVNEKTAATSLVASRFMSRTSVSVGVVRVLHNRRSLCRQTNSTASNGASGRCFFRESPSDSYCGHTIPASLTTPFLWLRLPHMPRPAKIEQERKTNILRIRLTADERRLLDQVSQGKTSTWAREILLAIAQKRLNPQKTD